MLNLPSSPYIRAKRLCAGKTLGPGACVGEVRRETPTVRSGYTILKRNKFFEVLTALVRQNRADDKVAILGEVDMSSAQRLRARFENTPNARPTYTALVAKALALALREHPHANRLPVAWPFWKRLVQFNAVDVSVAVERDLPGCEQVAFVDTLRGADRQDLASLTRELRALDGATPQTNARWRQFKWIIEKLPTRLAIWLLSMPCWFPGLWVEHRGGAALISSPAKYGGDAILAAWPWPLGVSFGQVAERPFVVEGRLAVRPTMMLTLSFNRHVMAGAPAARFFRRIVALLEDADELLQATP